MLKNVFFWADDRNRTYNLRITSAALYQLSYAGKWVNYLTPTVSTETVSAVFVESTTHESHDVESVEVASVFDEQEAKIAITATVKNTFLILFFIILFICINIRTFFLNSKLK